MLRTARLPTFLARSLWAERGRALFPGVASCGVVALASMFLSRHYGGPVMLFALLLGMAMNFLGEDGACRAGIEFSARSLLRAGVALLGLGITAAQVAALGWTPLALVLACVTLTISGSVLAARLLGFRTAFGLLTGGATAICGASAALALSAALPPHPDRERETLFTVIAVSLLSTLAMVGYPLLAHATGLDLRETGMFLGATIHDVAQVVGAGYSVSPQTGEVATLVKLLRVAMLLPVIVVAVLATRAQAGTQAGKRPPLLPGFALVFALLVAVNSLGVIPQQVRQAGTDAARWLLVASIAAIGMKTQLRELRQFGWRPVALVIGETVFLAGLALLLLRVAARLG